MRENNIMQDAFHASLDMARSLGRDTMGLTGFGVIELRDGDGRLSLVQPFANLITDAGDLYAASKLIVGIAPASPSAPTAANGMKLGLGTTAVAKNGSASTLITYLTSSQQAFDSTYPQTSNLGAGLGVTAVYKTTYAAGTATNTAITEAAIVNDAGTNGGPSASTTYSRTVFTAINKGASDSLAITWQWKQLGS